MSVTLSHEISHVNCMNLNAYTIVQWSLWWNVHNFFVDVHSLFESPKVALVFLINVSKSFNNGNWCFNENKYYQIKWRNILKYVLIILANYIFTTCFDLWMFKGTYDFFSCH